MRAAASWAALYPAFLRRPSGAPLRLAACASQEEAVQVELVHLHLHPLPSQPIDTLKWLSQGGHGGRAGGGPQSQSRSLTSQPYIINPRKWLAGAPQ